MKTGLEWVYKNDLFKEINMPVITISREIGSAGTYIALKLAEALECTSYDREIMNKIAEKMGKDKDQLADFDQETYSRIGIFFKEALASIAHGGMVFHPFGIGPLDWESMDMFSTFPNDVFTDSDYLEILTQVMNKIAQKSPAIILGRGGSQILHDHANTFHIRLVASIESRCKRIIEEQKIDDEQALAFISQRDESASKFIYDFFDKNIELPHHYHMVLNTDLISPDDCVKLILATINKGNK